MSIYASKLIASSFRSSLLLIYCYVLLTIVTEARVPTLPDSLRASSQLVYLEGFREKFFKIDEFISRSDGSIRLNVADYTEVANRNEPVLTTYFRLFQGPANGRHADDRLDKSVVALDTRTSECQYEHTTSWLLSELSVSLSKISEQIRTGLATDKTIEDPTAIGPTALLQLVYENPSRFHLDSEAYEDFVMADCYYFAASLDNFSTGSDGSAQPAKLIVSVLADRLRMWANESEAVDISNLIGSRLSEVNLSEHPALVALVVLPNIPGADQLKSSELLASLKSSYAQTSHRPPLSLIISYDSIRERSLSRHAGLEHVSEDLANPFQLPVGCGALTLQRPLYVTPRQFSGQFEALGFEGEKFAVAYDRASNHLRYDSLGEFKLIYSLNEYLATFISAPETTATLQANASNMIDSQFSRYYHQAHQNKERCTQTSILYEQKPSFVGGSWLLEKNSVADILGLGKRLGLMYLGQKRLPVEENEAGEDLMLCEVFEREVSAMQIPALLGMHTRNELNKRDSRFYLVFYFVDEINSTQQLLDTDAWQSMWLKRVELISIDSSNSFQQLEARLTFSSFSWSLESVETSDTFTACNNELTHPARTFDTIECWSERGQIRVDFLLKQVDERQWDESLEAGTRLKYGLQMLNSPEETLLVFLERKLMMPRAQINELDIVYSSAKADSAPDTSGPLASLGNIWVSFKLTKPFNYLYKRTLLGWVKNYARLLHAKQAKLVNYKTRMAYHECSSRLATQLNQPQSIYMLYCPNVGCGYLTAEKLDDVKHEKFEDIPDSEKSKCPFESSSRMCEIHRLVKTMSMREIESDLYKPEIIKRYLSKSSVMIYPGEANSISQQLQPYRSHVTKLTLLDGSSNHAGWDEVAIYGLCYTLGITLDFEGKPFRDEQHGFHLIQLDLDRHHSRAHCRRACLLYQFCQTYSYNRATRRCILTNIHRRFLSESKFSLDVSKLESSGDCSIYALDNAVLYKRSNSIDKKMPSELIEDKGVLLLSLSLSHCASLCHIDEFGLVEEQNATTFEQTKTTDCQSFNYLSLHSLCVLKDTGQMFDYKTGLVKREEHLTTPEQLEALLGGKQQMYEASAYERHTRNYAARFASRYGIKVDLNKPSEEMGAINHENGQLERVFKGLTLAECQRECAMLNKDCAMLDHCHVNKNGLQVKVCHLYFLRSPLSFASFQLDHHLHPAGETFKKLQLGPDNSDLIQQLTHSERLFYLEGESSKHELAIHSRNCHHFYLEGDNLYLDRLLAKSARSSHDEETSIEAFVRRDEATSLLEKPVQGASENLSALGHNPEAIVAGVEAISRIFVGFVIGLLVFWVQSRVVEVTSGMDLTKSLYSIKWFHLCKNTTSRSRTDRTMSMVDIVELADVDSP